VFLNNGQTVKADEAYIRESIVNPQAKLVNGFGPIMPTFQGQITEEQLVQILAFIKSLPAQGSQTRPAAPSPAVSAPAALSPAVQPAGSR
jgi:cytochrome c oxidase subunit 2